MKTPCAMRSAVKLARSGAVASSVVGTERQARLIQMPRRRSMRRLTSATRMLETAMPKVQALTATLIAAGLTP